MRMKMEGKVKRKGEPAPFFCVLTYSDLQSKNIMIQRTGSKEDGERIVCNLVGLIGRPWDGILNIENIATPSSRVNIEPSGWKEWKGFC